MSNWNNFKMIRENKLDSYENKEFKSVGKLNKKAFMDIMKNNTVIYVSILDTWGSYRDIEIFSNDTVFYGGILYQSEDPCRDYLDEKDIPYTS